MYTPILEKVASWLDTNPPEFNMSSWGQLEVLDERGGYCGTNFCIAGAIVHFGDPEYYELFAADYGVGETPAIGGEICEYAANLADLTLEQMADLFLGTPCATPTEAAAVIRDFIQTGRVSWIQP